MTAIDIIQAVADKHGFTLEQIRSPAKERRLCLAKWEAFHLLAERGLSQAQIGLLMHLHAKSVKVGLARYRANAGAYESIRGFQARRAAENAADNDNYDGLTEREELERRSDKLLRLIARDLRRAAA
jgi:predicted transcriptional regulator